MDKYRRVEKTRQIATIDEDEIRVTAVGSVSAYVSRAKKVFNELEKQEVKITGTGNAVAKAVQLAEVVKRRFKGLHQITTLSSTEIVDEWEPLEEGLDNVTETRNIPCINIVLSKEQLDESNKGYQPPIDESEVNENDVDEVSKSRGRGFGAEKGRGKVGKGTYEKGAYEKGDGRKGKGKGKSDKGYGWKGNASYDDERSWPSKGTSKGKEKGKYDYYGSKGKGSSKGPSKSSDWEYYPPTRGKGGKGSKGKPAEQYSNYEGYGYKSYSKGKGTSQW